MYLVSYASYSLTYANSTLSPHLVDAPISIVRLEDANGSTIVDITSVLTSGGSVGILQDRSKMFIAGAAH